MSNSWLTRIAIFTYIHSGIFFSVTALSTIGSVCGLGLFFFFGEYGTLNIYFTSINMAMMGLCMTLLFNRRTIIDYAMMQRIIADQNKVATSYERDFFFREADSEGFGLELRTYINSLEEQPRIRHFLKKSLELQQSKQIKA
ncbi:hypothetical protein ACI0X9_003266 [Cronobacter turicensis]